METPWWVYVGIFFLVPALCYWLVFFIYDRLFPEQAVDQAADEEWGEEDPT